MFKRRVSAAPPPKLWSQRWQNIKNAVSMVRSVSWKYKVTLEGPTAEDSRGDVESSTIDEQTSATPNLEAKQVPRRAAKSNTSEGLHYNAPRPDFPIFVEGEDRFGDLFKDYRVSLKGLLIPTRI